jgi:REP element-mobilizing transposase RayT
MISPISEVIANTASDLGVMPEYVHVFAQIPPTTEVAKVIGRWKGASSHMVNERFPQSLAKLTWQSGYGVLSVSQSGFDQVKEYVENQRERHARRELYGVLELTDTNERKRYSSKTS